MIHPRPTSTLFPYTTLFRSSIISRAMADGRVSLEDGRLILTTNGQRTERHLESQQEYYRSEEHTSELQSHSDIVCRLLLEKKNRPSSAMRRTRRGPLG